MAVLLIVPVGNAIAQPQSVRAQYQVSCTTCRVVFDSLVTLGNERDAVLIAPTTAVYRDSRGRFYTAAFDLSTIVVFDSIGRFVRTVGKSGDGPGEFGRRISRYQLSGDSLVILGDRMVVYSPSHAFVRSVDVNRGLTSNFAPLPDGRIVIAGTIATPTSVGLPWHVVDTKGQIAKSFGTDETTIPKSAPGVRSLGGLANFVLASRKDAIWAWSPYEYRGELWSITSGRQLSDFRVADVPWLPSAPPVVDLRPLMGERRGGTGAPAPGTNLGPPPTARAELSRVDAQNRLWVLAIVPFRLEARLSGKFAQCAGKPEGSTKGWRYCRLVEVIDPVSKGVLASQYVATSILSVAGTDLYYYGFEDKMGIPHVTVWRARLVGLK